MPKYELKFKTEIVKDFSGNEVEVVRGSSMEGFEPKIGKVRDVYDLNDNSLLIVASDRISAFDAVYPDLIPYKGKSLTALSKYWFEQTRHIIQNHLIEQINERTIRVKKAKRIDVEFIVRAYLYGSLWRDYRDGRRQFGDIKLPDGMQMAERLPRLMFTPTTKAETGHDAEISKEEAVKQKLIDSEVMWYMIKHNCFELFRFYSEAANKKGLIIPDFKLEFGIDMQIDEPPTHDSARWWAKQHYGIGQKQEANCLDKEFWREASKRLGYSGGEGEAPRMPQAVIDETSKRCVGLAKVLMGKAKVGDLNLRSVDDVVN